MREANLTEYGGFDYTYTFGMARGAKQTAPLGAPLLNVIGQYVYHAVSEVRPLCLSLHVAVFPFAPFLSPRALPRLACPSQVLAPVEVVTNSNNKYRDSLNVDRSFLKKYPFIPATCLLACADTSMHHASSLSFVTQQ